MKQSIAIVRGTTLSVKIKVNNADGTPHELLEGEIIRFGVKKMPADNEELISKELTSESGSNGEYTLILLPDDTKELPFGTYYYDVGLQSGVNYYNIVECSEFEIAYNITEVADNA